MNRQNKIIILVTTILILIVAVLAFVNTKKEPINPNKYDAFAQCLNDKGAVMYGAEWCIHCKAQKALFADSFKYIKYVECPDNTKICLDKNIGGYPTWLIGTSTRLEGEVTLEKLSEVSNCPLPITTK